ncbi:MAG: Holliday junction branch migration protein RuvA [Phycisphaerales bacterium]
MLYLLRGTLVDLLGTTAIVAPEGDDARQLEVMLPSYFATRLAASEGERVEFHTIEYLESHGQGSSFIPRLIGFPSLEARRFFELFTTVKGIGMRKALRAMAVSPAEIARAINERDTKFLTGLPELGKRSSETIVAELSGKVDAYVRDATAPSAPGAQVEAKPTTRLESEAAKRAVSALVRLGETENDARRLVERVLEADESLAEADAILAASFEAR